jgi:branched-chain amino acid transport system ATP-binding protein
LGGIAVQLEISDVHAHYNKSHILHGVSLSVAAGELVRLVGRNGVGKSTTLKSVIGIVRPSAGSITLDGVELSGQPSFRIARFGVGFVPEERRVFKSTTVEENLLLAARPTGGKTGSWTLERVYAQFPRLLERRRQKAGTLSGGEQQMLAICRALMTNPALLLVDEPTEGLAPAIVEQIDDLLSSLAAEGMAVLLVQQALNISNADKTRMYLMAKGTVVHAGFTGDLASDPKLRQNYLEVG